MQTKYKHVIRLLVVTCETSQFWTGYPPCAFSLTKPEAKSSIELGDDDSKLNYKARNYNIRFRDNVVDVGGLRSRQVALNLYS